MLTDLLVSTIGAFLGFLFALATQQLVVNSGKKKSYDSIRKELKAHIIHINQIKLYTNEPNCTLNELKEKVLQLAYSIYLPEWECVVQTGLLLEFLSSKNHLRVNEIINLYSWIYKISREIDNFFENQNSLQEDKLLEKILIDINNFSKLYNMEHIQKWLSNTKKENKNRRKK